jgi:hypothetical protein
VHEARKSPAGQSIDEQQVIKIGQTSVNPMLRLRRQLFDQADWLKDRLTLLVGGTCD